MSADVATWKADRRAALAAADGWLNLTDRIDLPSAPIPLVRRWIIPPVCPQAPPIWRISPSRTRVRSSQSPTANRSHFVRASGGFPQLTVSTFLLEIHPDHHGPAGIVARTAKHIYRPKGRDRDECHAHPPSHLYPCGPVSFAAAHPLEGGAANVRNPRCDVRTGAHAASHFQLGEDVTETTITLDFNRAHNPPRASTEFAICPLPPHENILPFSL